MDDALYGPDGFYTSGRGAGRQRDFLTSPEVGPLFGAVVSRFVMNQKASVVVEAGAGTGALAASVDVPGVKWLAVERSPALRAQIIERGFQAAPDLPPKANLIIANELLDNLPPLILERTAGGWAEVRVEGGREVLAPWTADDDVPDVDAKPGARIPVHRRARQWIAQARATGAHVVCIDYTTTTQRAADAPMDEWLRTYRGHTRGAHWLTDLGQQDITCQVCLDQLEPDRTTTQADWLHENGIDDLVAEARQAWEVGAARPDLVALKARSRLTEAKALTDPAGLGAFTVMEWGLPDRAVRPRSG